ncbi:MAG: small acid-soluble spore protein Tlp [Bacillota bacterium]|nr:small acid-soluble spore protein Tlp [Bacillota bacterium]HHU62212.1 small acid-soluble spore protein Tlp [Natronincola sp.]
MPDKRKKGAQSKEEQLENTRARMDEADDRLELSNMSEEEKENIRLKNKHRAEQIEGLESELSDGYDDEDE